MFEIGDEVICIDDSIKPGMEEFVLFAYSSWVKKGKKYIVRGFTDNDGIVTGVWLEEIVSKVIYQPLLGYEQEPAFRLNRFAKSEKNYTYSEEEQLEEIYN